MTGYGPVDGDLRNLLAPAKSALVAHCVERAKREGWTMGASNDPTVHNGYHRVIYIDTPLGQISFHVRGTRGAREWCDWHDSDAHTIPATEGEYGDLPLYAGEWSGDCGATERTCAPIRCRIAGRCRRLIEKAYRR